MGELAGRRILVVGASSGIGRVFATAAAARGARLALAARRRDRLEEAVAEARGGIAVVGDVRRPADCERIVAEAVSALGGLDSLLYSAGIMPLARLADADSEHWRRIFETNFFGAVHVTRAAIPHLEPRAVVAYLSSDTVGRPRAGLGAYSVSKAALDESILAWRTEHPELRFLRAVVGPTIGTEAGANLEPALVAELMGDWLAQGFMTREHLDAADLGSMLAETLMTLLAHPEISLEDLRVRPPGPKLTLAPDSAPAHVENSVDEVAALRRRVEGAGAEGEEGP